MLEKVFVECDLNIQREYPHPFVLAFSVSIFGTQRTLIFWKSEFLMDNAMYISCWKIKLCDRFSNLSRLSADLNC